MTMEVAMAWAVVAVGLVLCLLGLRATFYFRRQSQIAGMSWILDAFYHTSLTITMAAAILTLARAGTLTFGRSSLISIIAGLMIIWLLLIPLFLERVFRNHEGRSE